MRIIVPIYYRTVGFELKSALCLVPHLYILLHVHLGVPIQVASSLLRFPNELSGCVTSSEWYSFHTGETVRCFFVCTRGGGSGCTSGTGGMGRRRHIWIKTIVGKYFIGGKPQIPRQEAKIWITDMIEIMVEVGGIDHKKEV